MRTDVPFAGCEACHGPGSAHVANPSDISQTIISFSHKSGTPIPVPERPMPVVPPSGRSADFLAQLDSEDNKARLQRLPYNPMTNFAAYGADGAQVDQRDLLFLPQGPTRAVSHALAHAVAGRKDRTCVDCHNPHGSTTDPRSSRPIASMTSVTAATPKRKRGPSSLSTRRSGKTASSLPQPALRFPISESLLTAPRPMLCQQCHAQAGHPAQLLHARQPRRRADFGSTPDIDIVPDLPRRYPWLELDPSGRGSNDEDRRS